MLNLLFYVIFVNLTLHRPGSVLGTVSIRKLIGYNISINNLKGWQHESDW